MSKSPKGSVSQPGKKVRQNSGLNRAILDQGWDEFRQQLAYKMEWNGGVLLAAPPYHTSQTCPALGAAGRERRVRRRFNNKLLAILQKAALSNDWRVSCEIAAIQSQFNSGDGCLPRKLTVKF